MTSQLDIAAPDPVRLAPIGVAIVGCGRISDSHIRAVQAQPDLGTVVALVDIDHARAAEMAARFGIPHAFGALDEALALSTVEAVILCSPNAEHAPQALAAMGAGRHVLVEKPFAETEADAVRMAALAEQTGLVLAAAHTFRHVAAVRYLQDHLADFGRLQTVAVTMCVRWEGPQTPWWATRTPQEGLIMTQFAPHALDFVQMVVGDADPVRTHIETGRYQDGWLAEDEAMILLRYAGGVMASVHVSYNQHHFSNDRVLAFDKGTVRIQDGEYLWVGDTLVVEPEFNDRSGFHRMGGDHYYRTQFSEFVRAIRGQDHRSVLHGEAVRLVKLQADLLRDANAAPPV